MRPFGRRRVPYGALMAADPPKLGVFKRAMLALARTAPFRKVLGPKLAKLYDMKRRLEQP